VPYPDIEPATGLIVDLDELRSRAGQFLGNSLWHTVSQEDVDTFAALTGDHQWIHVDPQRAASGPFGGTIAYGYLTLSLATVALDEVVGVKGAEVVLNYGADRVRFPAPVPTGSRVRAGVELTAVDELPGGVQTHYKLTFEVEGQAKPGCVAEILFRYYTEFPGTKKSESN
jgi:acyl dehydratase